MLKRVMPRGGQDLVHHSFPHCRFVQCVVHAMISLYDDRIDRIDRINLIGLC